MAANAIKAAAERCNIELTYDLLALVHESPNRIKLLIHHELGHDQGASNNYVSRCYKLLNSAARDITDVNGAIGAERKIVRHLELSVAIAESPDSHRVLTTVVGDY